MNINKTYLVLNSAEDLPPLRVSEPLWSVPGLAQQVLAARTAWRGLVVTVASYDVPSHHWQVSLSPNLADSSTGFYTDSQEPPAHLKILTLLLTRRRNCIQRDHRFLNVT